MQISGEHIDLFERFNQQLLSEKEVLEFDARIAYDDDFRLQFEQYKEIEQGIREHYRNELKQGFQSIDNELDHKQTNKSIVKSIGWFIAAAAAILVVVLMVLKRDSNDEMIQLAKSYWPEEPGLPVKMSAKGAYDDAMNAYKLKEYDKASMLLESIATDTSFYFQGVIAFETDQLNEAGRSFKKIKKTSSYRNEAQFRLALVYIAKGEYKEARKLLQSQVDHQTPFASVSKVLLQKVN